MKYSRTTFARAYADLVGKYSELELAQGFALLFSRSKFKRDVKAFSEDVVRLWGDEHNTAIITVTSAHKLSLAARKRISKYISEQEGKKHVSATYAISPSLIGGATVQTPTHTYDFSVHGTLAQLL